MINNFFINLLLLISVIFIAGHVSKDKPFNYDSPVSGKIILGIGGGILGIGMMIYTIMIEGTVTIIDLRVMPVMMTYYIGGPIPAVITSTIILTFRILYYGMSHSAVVGMIQVIVLIPIYYIIDRFEMSNKRRWTTMVLTTMIVLVSTVYSLLYKVNSALIVLLIYSVSYIIAFILANILLQYVRSANELYRRYKGEAYKDFLTGLNNTRQFDLTFNHIIEEALVKHESISCLMIDIDHFKEINDTYGHAAGNLVLKELSRIIKNTCRESDDISRIGGEEFCALMINCTFNHAEVIGNRICDTVRKNKFIIGSSTVCITVSVGISTFPGTVDSPEKILEQADQALYRAKQTGRDRVCSVNDLKNVSFS